MTKLRYFFVAALLFCQAAQAQHHQLSNFETQIVSVQNRNVSEQQYQPSFIENVNTIASVNATLIGSSQNVFTFTDYNQRQVSALQDGQGNDWVSFVFRKKVTGCGGSSGEYMYNLSGDRGNSWYSTADSLNCVGFGPINNVNTFLGRFPSSIIFTTPSNELRLAYAGPTLPSIAGAAWQGDMVLGLAKDLTTTPIITQERYYHSFDSTLYRPSTIVKRGNSNEFWFVVGVKNKISGMDSAIHVWKGTYIPLGDSINWQLNQQIDMITYLNLGNTLFDEQICFSPDGTKGYITAIGDLIGGVSDTYLPIVMEFDINTLQFGTPYELISPISAPNVSPPNYALYDSLTLYVSTFTDSTGVTITNDIMTLRKDAVVDSLGNLNLLTVIVPAYVSPNLYNYYPNFGARMILFARDPVGNWNISTISKIYRIQEDIGSGADLVVHTAIPQITSNSTGGHFFFQWTDSDSITNLTNPIGEPNVIGCSYNPISQTISDTTNWTFGDAIWSGKIHVTQTAPTAIAVGASSCEYYVSTVVLEYPDITLPNAPLLPVNFHYFNNISYCTTNANTPITWLMRVANSSINDNLPKLPFAAYPNPASHLINIHYQTTMFSDINIQLTDLNGKIVRQLTKQSIGAQNDQLLIEGVSSGLYFLQLQTSEGVGVQKIMIK